MDAISIMTAHIHVAARAADWRAVSEEDRCYDDACVAAANGITIHDSQALRRFQPAPLRGHLHS